MALADRTAQLAVTLVDTQGEDAGALLARLKRFCEERGTTLRAAVSLAIWRHMANPPEPPKEVAIAPLPACAATEPRPGKPGRKRKSEIA